ncbi:MAG TPA: M23 family metallopeptidase [Gaiellaceae bacterium]|nr:M23 family metallopeptidase [Gaiellaceae bacterium]
MIRLAVAVVGALVASSALAAAAPPPRDASTGANAFLLQITIPGQDTVLIGGLEWPTSTTADVQSFQYPADGSIVRIGRSRATTFASPGSAATTQSFAEAIVVSLFNGEIVAGRVTASVSAGASARSAGADATASAVQGLRALGSDVASAPGSVSLEDWGTMTVLSSDSGSRRAGPPGAQASVTALRIVLSADHGGLPAGSEIVIGNAQAVAVADLSAPPRPPPSRNLDDPRTTPDGRPDRHRAPEPDDVGGEVAGGPVKVAPEVSADLSAGGYVFPVYGTASFGDSFGGPRPNIPGGWHHGEDIFAAEGTPLLAVAGGTLHTIGFTKIGGYRLWLRDTEGNEFYYAHLSAYSPLAVEGRTVEAGDVIGFVGDTGDAEGGSPHLHFEIHPSSMAGLGYDGVVAPYSILLAWRRADDISFSAGRIFTPVGPGSTTLPPPGAVLLEANDIAGTSGLVPGALEKALTR